MEDQNRRMEEGKEVEVWIHMPPTPSLLGYLGLYAFL
jgi:hypothetical protein